MSVTSRLYYETLETMRTLEIGEETVNRLLRVVSEVRTTVIEVNMFLESHPKFLAALAALSIAREVYAGFAAEEARKARMEEVTEKMIDKLTVRE